MIGPESLKLEVGTMKFSNELEWPFHFTLTFISTHSNILFLRLCFEDNFPLITGRDFGACSVCGLIKGLTTIVVWVERTPYSEANTVNASYYWITFKREHFRPTESVLTPSVQTKKTLIIFMSVDMLIIMIPGRIKRWWSRCYTFLERITCQTGVDLDDCKRRRDGVKHHQLFACFVRFVDAMSKKYSQVWLNSLNRKRTYYAESLHAIIYGSQFNP